MAAIITDDFRRNAAQILVDDVTTSGGSNYYVGIGKSDAYDADGAGYSETDASFSLPVPAASRAEELEVLNNITTLSKVGTNSAFRVMPRVYYQTSKRYKVYDPNDANCFFAETIGGNEYEPCYVINSDLEVYICLKNHGTMQSNADDEPKMDATLNSIFGANETGKNNGLITTADDHFRWAYVCTLNRDSGFFTTQFAAIGNPGSGAVDNPALTAYSTSDHPSETSGGLIYGFKVTNGGSGYTAGDLTVSCTGLKTDGSDGNSTDLVQFNQDIHCTITVDNGVITQCVTELSSNEINTTDILGVVNAKAVPVSSSNGGTGAILEPMILPLEGVGTNNLKLLPSYYCGIRANFEDDLGGDGLIIPFRQISLLKDPVLSNGDTPSATSSYGANDAAKGLRYVTCTAALPGDLETGDILFDSSSESVEDAITDESPVAIFDHLDTTEDRLYYHQNFDDDDGGQNLLELAKGGRTLKWYDKSAGQVSSNTIQYTGDPQYPEFTIVDYTNANTDSGTEKFGQLNSVVLFIENRSPVTRAADQIEEVRMIIQF